MNRDDRLGPYRLLRRLGEGGMGVVHLALDSQGRQVAIKVLRSEVAGDDLARRRLAREVETMRRVRHHNIAEVLDADVTGSRPYIVTRYVPGMPLDDTVKRDGPLEPLALLRVAHGVAEALAAVHAAGVIHRDLKPGNVLLLDGEPVLIDFGIAQAVDSTRLTQTGMFIGTPGYLAPEIIEGHEAGPEVDVHAWAGTVLYAATGLPPFGKGTLEMVFYNITAGKADVGAAPALLRPSLRAAFHRDPARRPTAARLAAQLTRLVPPPTGRPGVPDEVLTVPDVPGGELPPAGPRPVNTGPLRTGSPAPGRSPLPEPLPEPVTGTALPGSPASGPAVPGTAVPGAAAGEFVSLLSDVPPGPVAGDPFPTVRVTGDALGKAGLPRQSPAVPPPSPGIPAALPAEGDVPTRFVPPGHPSQPWTGTQPGFHDQGEVPTRRVRGDELSELEARSGGHRPASGPPAPHGATNVPGLPAPHARPGTAPSSPHGVASPPGRGTGAAPPHGMASSSGQGVTPSSARGPATPAVRGRQGGPGAHPHHQALFEQAPDIFEKTPHVRQHQAPAYVPTMRLPPDAPPDPGQAVGAAPLPRSPLYGVASVLSLVIAVGAAVAVPVLVTGLAVIAVVLLRAADIAQPRLGAIRPPQAAAADVFRVLGRPGALLKSIGVTLALLPYALILGVPVSLVLAFLARSVPAGTVLSWGVAVSLWIICAGPGVEGPGRQMNRTLASALPSKGAAVALICVLAVVATAAALYAAASLIRPVGEAVWSPVDMADWLRRLEDLRMKAG